MLVAYLPFMAWQVVAVAFLPRLHSPANCPEYSFMRESLDNDSANYGKRHVLILPSLCCSLQLLACVFSLLLPLMWKKIRLWCLSLSLILEIQVSLLQFFLLFFTSVYGKKIMFVCICELMIVSERVNVFFKKKNYYYV